MLIKKLKYVSLLLIIVFETNISHCQNKLLFGLNPRYDDSSLIQIVYSPIPIGQFLKNYDITYLRFPGGLYARTFFWDKTELISKSLNLYSSLLAGKGEEKAQRKSKYNKNLAEKSNVKADYYVKYLEFCKKNEITPIIQLNTFYYHDDQGNVFPIWNKAANTIESQKWDAVLTNIKQQVTLTHKYFSNVIWEIGNEDHHIYPSQIYAQITGQFSAAIKGLFKNDKVIMQFANAKTEINEDWNGNLISYLEKNGYIQNIDYVAPHYYHNYDKVTNNQAVIDDMVGKLDIYTRSKAFLTTLQNHPNIKVFYTEFGIFRKAEHPNFNSQIHALILLSYLMQFNASPKVDDIIMHGFTQPGTSTFYTDLSLKRLKYSVTNTSEPTYTGIKYIPPQAKAIKVFFDNNTLKASEIGVKKNIRLIYTYSQTQNGVIINLLNYSSQDIQVNLNDLFNKFGGNSNFKVTTYKFSDINNKQWNADDNTIVTTQKSNSIKISGYSFAVLNGVK